MESELRGVPDFKFKPTPRLHDTKFQHTNSVIPGASRPVGGGLLTLQHTSDACESLGGHARRYLPPPLPAQLDVSSSYF
jgi:hypothetical protein